MMHDAVRNYWMAFNDPLEGKVAYMYLDVKGWVSTGVGNLIDATKAELSPPSPDERTRSLAMAGQMNWLTASNESASADEVAADWDAVKSRLDLAPQGHLAFQPLTHLHLSDEEIERVVLAKVDEMEGVLTSTFAEFSDFESMPSDAQQAVLSMSWGIGPYGFKGFPSFRAAVASRDWSEAAKQSKFNPDIGTIQIRNKLDVESLLNAGLVESLGLDSSLLTINLQTTIGIQTGLLLLGFRPGRQDGEWGPTTAAAVSAYQGAKGQNVDGQVNADVITSMAADLEAMGRNVVTP